MDVIFVPVFHPNGCQVILLVEADRSGDRIEIRGYQYPNGDKVDWVDEDIEYQIYQWIQNNPDITTSKFDGSEVGEFYVP